jgi:Uma2 family endonuclease
MLVEKSHRFTVAEYQRMGETGILPTKARVELLDGQIIDMSPIGHFHSGIVARLVRLFGKLSKDRWLVWPQSSVPLDEHSEPQPDIVLLKPSSDDYTTHAPSPDDIFLLIEVADSSLSFDREKKLPLYGRAGITEVWIVNLIDRTIEIYYEPNFTGYGKTTILRSGDKASPLAFPDVCVNVADLLKTTP